MVFCSSGCDGGIFALLFYFFAAGRLRQKTRRLFALPGRIYPVVAASSPIIIINKRNAAEEFTSLPEKFYGGCRCG